MRFNTKLALSSITSVSVIGLLGFSAGPAMASTEQPDAITVIEDIAPSVLTNMASYEALLDESLGEVEIIGEEGSVVVPSAPADPLILSNDQQTDISVILPIESAKADDSLDAAPVYSSGTDAELVPIVKDDGSVQVTTVLSSAAAPTRYDYVFAAGTELQLTPDGYVIITDSNGDYIGAVMPAWATDSTGAEVPTHFEVNGFTLTQVVDHADAVHPVVADPYMGKALISKVTVGSEKGKPRYSVTKTTWGNSIAQGWGIGLTEQPVLGAQIMRGQGWDEAVAKGLSTATTIRQQYDCHTVYAAAKNPWNLERWRGTNSSWLTNPKLCNW